MASTPIPRLFTPIRIGDIVAQHRVALAPLTRFRAGKKDHVPIDVVPEYYAQRASFPGTFMISEATIIAPQAGGYDHVPGIWSDAQIARWKEVTDAVHAKGSFIYMQLWALGRAADTAVLEEDGFDYVSASDIPLSSSNIKPRPLTKSEIQEYLGLYAQAAENAITAGFDGVEVHATNGYLLDQFIHDVTNHRTDEYGGSIENRARFPLEVVKAVVNRVGEKKTGVRIGGGWSTYNEVGMKNPVPQFSYIISQLAERHPELAFIHLVEPRVSGVADVEVNNGESNDPYRKIWAPRTLLIAGGYTAESAFEASEKNENEVIVFGRSFISNPDLPARVKYGIPLAPYHRETFYTPEEPKGYADYPVAEVPIEVRA